MLQFNPQKGLKQLLPVYGFLTLILIPTFIILLSMGASFLAWALFLFFSYTFVTLVYLIAQKKTKYWIEGNSFFYKSLFLKGKIEILSIRKLEVNATNWLNGKPATSNTKGIFIYYNKFEDTFITPEDNMKVVEELLKINPAIEIIHTK